MNKLILTTVAFTSLATAVAGCNTGGRSGSKTVFGPGSTGNIGSGGLPGGGGLPGTSGTWTAAGALNGPRMFHTATALSDGRVLVVNGVDGPGQNAQLYSDSEIFDPLTNTWTLSTQVTGTPNDGLMINAAANNFDTSRNLHSATLLPNSQVLIAGGEGLETAGGPAAPMVSCYLFDPLANKFNKTADIPNRRLWHSATLLSNGKVLLGGGFDSAGNSSTTNDVFDPQAGVWQAGTPGGSAAHTWGVLATSPPGGSAAGKTVIHGGAEFAAFTFSAFPGARTQVFNPATNAMSPGPATNTIGDVLDHAGNGMTSGKIFYAGGRTATATAINQTELYDPAANSFTAGPPMSTGRWLAQMAELGTTSDQIIVGGAGIPQGSNPPPPIASSEVWSAFSNAFVGTANMQQGRYDHQIVVLRSGQILAIGGEDGSIAFDSCEVFTP